MHASGKMAEGGPAGTAALHTASAPVPLAQLGRPASGKTAISCLASPSTYMSSPTTSQQCDLRIQCLTMPIRCPHFGKSVLNTADQFHQRLCTNGVGIRRSLRRQRRRAVCCGRHDGSAWPSVAAEPEIWLHCFLCSAQAHRARAQVRLQLVLHHGAACRASVSSVVRIKVSIALISCRSWQRLPA